MIEKLATMNVPVDRLDTWNAGSNAPMLGINVSMGFKRICVYNTWQGDLATANELLSRG